MPSPFPGMDPWLENSELFPDLHNRLIIFLSEAISLLLPPGYTAMSANRIFVRDEEVRVPDVAVRGRGRPPAGGAGVLEMPGVIRVGRPVVPEPDIEPFIEIRTDRGRRLVTALEILSPTNKHDPAGRTAYRRKQREFTAGQVCLIEIDLLRGGQHMTSAPLSALRTRVNNPEYHAAILRPWIDEGLGDVGILPIPLRDPLPALPVPLDPGIAPIVIPMQPLLDRCYDTMRYGENVDYHADPTPPLSDEQSAWADAVLREKGLRN